jgi:hypothetical protein
VKDYLTAFENYFNALKKLLENENVYDVWPDFEPQYDEREYTWASLRGLGEVLMLNCGVCDGPSDMRHARCNDCVERRGNLAKGAYEKATGRSKEKWTTLFLCRIQTE